MDARLRWAGVHNKHHRLSDNRTMDVRIEISSLMAWVIHTLYCSKGLENDSSLASCIKLTSQHSHSQGRNVKMSNWPKGYTFLINFDCLILHLSFKNWRGPRVFLQRPGLLKIIDWSCIPEESGSAPFCWQIRRPFITKLVNVGWCNKHDKLAKFLTSRHTWLSHWRSSFSLYQMITLTNITMMKMMLVMMNDGKVTEPRTDSHSCVVGDYIDVSVNSHGLQCCSRRTCTSHVT